ncbi:hypothetical protein Q3G72_033543 [Acer saccharum]|nr:hypothetical protein Q3G72_033543 [Acer saccharum]
MSDHDKEFGSLIKEPLFVPISVPFSPLIMRLVVVLSSETLRVRSWLCCSQAFEANYPIKAAFLVAILKGLLQFGIDCSLKILLSLR